MAKKQGKGDTQPLFDLHNIRKRYGAFEALKGLTVKVEPGAPDAEAAPPQGPPPIAATPSIDTPVAPVQRASQADGAGGAPGTGSGPADPPSTPGWLVPLGIGLALLVVIVGLTLLT